MAIDGHGDSSVLTLLYRESRHAVVLDRQCRHGGVDSVDLQVARFLLPVVVIYGAFAGLVMLFRDRFQQVRVAVPPAPHRHRRPR